MLFGLVCITGIYITSQPISQFVDEFVGIQFGNFILVLDLNKIIQIMVYRIEQSCDYTTKLHNFAISSLLLKCPN